MATTQFTVPDAELPRLAAAVGRKDNLRDAQNAVRSATGAEVKQHIINYCKTLVEEDEAAQGAITAKAQAKANIIPIT